MFILNLNLFFHRTDKRFHGHTLLADPRIGVYAEGSSKPLQGFSDGSCVVGGNATGRNDF